MERQIAEQRLTRTGVAIHLGLEYATPPLLNSLERNFWWRLNNNSSLERISFWQTNRIILECRNPQILQSPRAGAVNIYDFDDCLMATTSWHRQEYQLVEQSSALRAGGVVISLERAQEIYELSKIYIKDLAEKEPRYTPKFNLILLSIFAHALRSKKSEEQAWNELQEKRTEIQYQVQAQGERELRAEVIDPEIARIFMNNSPANFIYSEFVQDLFEQTRAADIRIIATRGKIEDPLGQVYKVHTSGLMKQKSRRGLGVDAVVYSNDAKAEALLLLMKLLPEVGDRLIRIYDDNPNEILPYLETARSLGARNIEVIQVSHPDAKRKDVSVGVEPRLSYLRGETRLRHYSAFPNIPNIPVTFT